MFTIRTLINIGQVVWNLLKAHWRKGIKKWIGVLWSFFESRLKAS